METSKSFKNATYLIKETTHPIKEATYLIKETTHPIKETTYLIKETTYLIKKTTDPLKKTTNSLLPLHQHLPGRESLKAKLNPYSETSAAPASAPAGPQREWIG